MQKYQFQSQFIAQEEYYDILVVIIIAFLISDFKKILDFVFHHKKSIA